MSAADLSVFAAKTGCHSVSGVLNVASVINIVQTAPDLLRSQYYHLFFLQKARLVRGE